MTLGHRKPGGDRVIENISIPACLNPRPSAWFAKQLCLEGLITGTPLFQLCLGIKWGAPYDSETMMYKKA